MKRNKSFEFAVSKKVLRNHVKRAAIYSLASASFLALALSLSASCVYAAKSTVSITNGNSVYTIADNVTAASANSTAVSVIASTGTLAPTPDQKVTLNIGSDGNPVTIKSAHYSEGAALGVNYYASPLDININKGSRIELTPGWGYVVNAIDLNLDGHHDAPSYASRLTIASGAIVGQSYSEANGGADAIYASGDLSIINEGTITSKHGYDTIQLESDRGLTITEFNPARSYESVTDAAPKDKGVPYLGNGGIISTEGLGMTHGIYMTGDNAKSYVGLYNRGKIDVAIDVALFNHSSGIELQRALMRNEKGAVIEDRSLLTTPEDVSYDSAFSLVKFTNSNYGSEFYNAGKVSATPMAGNAFGRHAYTFISSAAKVTDDSKANVDNAFLFHNETTGVVSLVGSKLQLIDHNTSITGISLADGNVYNAGKINLTTDALAKNVTMIGVSFSPTIALPEPVITTPDGRTIISITTPDINTLINGGDIVVNTSQGASALGIAVQNTSNIHSIFVKNTGSIFGTTNAVVGAIALDNDGGSIGLYNNTSNGDSIAVMITAGDDDGGFVLNNNGTIEAPVVNATAVAFSDTEIRLINQGGSHIVARGDGTHSFDSPAVSGVAVLGDAAGLGYIVNSGSEIATVPTADQTSSKHLSVIYAQPSRNTDVTVNTSGIETGAVPRFGNTNPFDNSGNNISSGMILNIKDGSIGTQGDYQSSGIVLDTNENELAGIFATYIENDPESIIATSGSAISDFGTLYLNNAGTILSDQKTTCKYGMTTYRCGTVSTLATDEQAGNASAHASVIVNTGSIIAGPDQITSAIYLNDSTPGAVVYNSGTIQASANFASNSGSSYYGPDFNFGAALNFGAKNSDVTVYNDVGGTISYAANAVVPTSGEFAQENSLVSFTSDGSSGSKFYNKGTVSATPLEGDLKENSYTIISSSAVATNDPNTQAANAFLFHNESTGVVSLIGSKLQSTTGFSDIIGISLVDGNVYNAGSINLTMAASTKYIEVAGVSFSPTVPLKNVLTSPDGRTASISGLPDVNFLSNSGDILVDASKSAEAEGIAVQNNGSQLHDIFVQNTGSIFGTDEAIDGRVVLDNKGVIGLFNYEDAVDRAVVVVEEDSVVLNEGGGIIKTLTKDNQTKVKAIGIVFDDTVRLINQGGSSIVAYGDNTGVKSAGTAVLSEGLYVDYIVNSGVGSTISSVASADQGLFSSMSVISVQTARNTNVTVDTSDIKTGAMPTFSNTDPLKDNGDVASSGIILNINGGVIATGSSMTDRTKWADGGGKQAGGISINSSEASIVSTYIQNDSMSKITTSGPAIGVTGILYLNNAGTISSNQTVSSFIDGNGYATVSTYLDMDQIGDDAPHASVIVNSGWIIANSKQVTSAIFLDDSVPGAVVYNSGIIRASANFTPGYAFNAAGHFHGTALAFGETNFGETVYNSGMIMYLHTMLYNSAASKAGLVSLVSQDTQDKTATLVNTGAIGTSNSYGTGPQEQTAVILKATRFTAEAPDNVSNITTNTNVYGDIASTIDPSDYTNSDNFANGTLDINVDGVWTVDDDAAPGYKSSTLEGSVYGFNTITINPAQTAHYVMRTTGDINTTGTLEIKSNTFAPNKISETTNVQINKGATLWFGAGQGSTALGAQIINNGTFEAGIYGIQKNGIRKTHNFSPVPYDRFLGDVTLTGYSGKSGGQINAYYGTNDNGNFAVNTFNVDGNSDFHSTSLVIMHAFNFTADGDVTQSALTGGEGSVIDGALAAQLPETINGKTLSADFKAGKVDMLLPSGPFGLTTLEYKNNNLKLDYDPVGNVINKDATYSTSKNISYAHNVHQVALGLDGFYKATHHTTQPQAKGDATTTTSNHVVNQADTPEVEAFFSYINSLASSAQFNDVMNHLAPVLYGDITTATVNNIRDFNDSLFDNFQKADTQKPGTIAVWGDIGYGYHSTGGKSYQKKTTSSSPYIRGYVMSKPVSDAFFGGAIGVNTNKVTVKDIDQSATGVAVQLAVFGGMHAHQSRKWMKSLDNVFVNGALSLQYGSSSAKRKKVPTGNNKVEQKSKPKSFGFLVSASAGGTFKFSDTIDMSPYVKLDLGMIRANSVNEGLSETNFTAAKIASNNTVIGSISFGIRNHMLTANTGDGSVDLYSNLALNVNLGTKRAVKYDTFASNTGAKTTEQTTIVDGAQVGAITFIAGVNADVKRGENFHFLAGIGIEGGTNSTLGAHGEIGIGYDFS